ncbi:outer membrane usher protein [Pantoea sp.]|uniref:outer membrane usher protein n=1 Tax=Pantoea sp. TaxID=69393 RepID=UPI0031DF9A96
MKVVYFNISLTLQPKILSVVIASCLLGFSYQGVAEEIEFNTDILDINDRKNIDLSRFSKSGFILPGEYEMVVMVNKRVLPEQTIVIQAVETDNKNKVCITPELVEQFGLRKRVFDKIVWNQEEKCLDAESLKGLELRPDLSTSTLYISVPQAYLQYFNENWDAPAQWDNGLPGVLFDYNLNGQTQSQKKGQRLVLNANGTTGANLGAWRLRADWQSQPKRINNNKSKTLAQRFDWSRYYAYRAIPGWEAKVSVGEDYLSSELFDSFSYAGASLASDDSQLPPNLRGYAPEVTGIARTNALVIISQQGRILKEIQVAAGPFRIQDIENSVSGKLDVRVEEQDGEAQTFSIETSNIPYLTRPGRIRYKFFTGKLSTTRHQLKGPGFVSGELSWGVSNGWSLFGGGIGTGNYSAFALGLGRDLYWLGAMSFDITQSRAVLSNLNETLTGRSYRLSYSKNFEQYDSQITFAGYRFSERNFLSMNEYLDARKGGAHQTNSKELYTITFNKQFRDWRLSAYVNYNHQTYWNLPDNDRYSATLSKYFDLGRLRNLSLSFSAYRTINPGNKDEGVFLSLSVPIGNNSTLSYSAAESRGGSNQRVSYYGRINQRDSYQLGTGINRDGSTANGSITHDGELAYLNANVNTQSGKNTQAGFNIRGGATATTQGAALHGSTNMGGTRLMIDTDAVADIPVSSGGLPVHSNRFGKLVVTSVNSYYRNSASLDVNNLPDNVDAVRSVVEATLTEGAIGYRKFDVIAGEKAMAILRLADGSYPPFGATVRNRKKQEVGIVSDSGNVYLTGINPGESMTVNWSEKSQCVIELPATLTSVDMTANLFLPCRRESDI